MQKLGRVRGCGTGVRSAPVIFQIATLSFIPPTFCPADGNVEPPLCPRPPLSRPRDPPYVFVVTRGGSRLLTRNEVI